jgi:hypothetical protein
MAAPNLTSLTTVTGKSYVTSSLPSGSANSASLVSNAAGSNSVVKINVVTYTNKTIQDIAATLIYNSASVNYYLAKDIIVPVQSSMIVVAQDTRLYLEEGTSIQGYANATASIDPFVSYEVLS